MLIGISDFFIIIIIIFYEPRFSSRMGYCIKNFKPIFGVIFPFNIAATPEIIGNLKSIISGRILVMTNCSSARAVATPIHMKIEDNKSK